ncbi:MAG: alpha/beta fold hydrolase [Pseudomonadota bacterium]
MTLVLLPGFMCDARLFAPQIDALRGQCQVMPLTPVAPSMDEMVAAVLEAAPTRFALAGLSMGGIVALTLMARAPERVERLALIDTTPRADAPANHAIRTGQIKAVADGALRQVVREELKPNYLADAPGQPEVLDLCLAMAVALGPEVFAAQSLALRDRASQEAVLPQITVPSLVMCGAQDALCPPALHREMAETIPGARLEIIEGAGHLPTLEQPGAVSRALTTWLEA